MREMADRAYLCLGATAAVIRAIVDLNRAMADAVAGEDPSTAARRLAARRLREASEHAQATVHAVEAGCPAPDEVARLSNFRTEDTKHIMCSECGFDMCYSCQTPWHPGLSCAQYNSQRDPSYSRTQVWLARHTKPCPGCGVQLLKGEGCFHMTCSKCRFEFCWECLADWRNIQFKVGRGPGAEMRHRSSAHREGCYFRRAGSKLPTQVMGRTLETGLRQLADVDAAE